MKKFIILIFTLFIIFSCKNDPHHLVRIEGKLIPISEELNPKEVFETTIEPYKVKVEAEMNAVLSFTPNELNRLDGKLESSLGNLMADLCYEKADPVFNSRTSKNIDFTMLNFGGIRAGISKGDITMEHAFNLMPFENELVVVELTTDKLYELINYLITENRAHPISKHLNLEITKNGYNLKINNQPIEASKTYYVLTSDYLQNGGDNMIFFKNPVNLYKTDYKVRNAIIDYFKENDTIKVNLDGRFRSEI
ncbi:MAG: 5'-nucleotidase C-terminal domain-containing protein [Lutibacter sp.]|uniref:5'-nucleotidase C-terminal domain-containing protein n=1 Tax=Lutibacter sp. TaxID=1925666 RepID=UPI001808AEB1|nr:5'-nucleotidase [Lutibacter sp.]MBT8317125.1 5'-nucleotidase C-terminal domain-containing protein [Lutibacter sp.]NNJ57985.1 5'-nucleotidase C-terminal domain-containing protein [Lutibacter sp.]